MLCWLATVAVALLGTRAEYAGYEQECPPEYESNLGLPSSAVNVIIDVGANVDPIMPSKNNTNEWVLAIEPVHGTLNKMRGHSRQLRVSAALSSGHPRLRFINLEHTDFQSSASISNLTEDKKYGIFGVKQRGKQPVITIPLCAIIMAIPKSIEISYLKIDAQGHDLDVIRSAGRHILRIPLVMLEVNLDGFQSNVGAQNDFLMDVHPYMTRVGYRLGPKGAKVLAGQNHTTRTASVLRPGIKDDEITRAWSGKEANVVYFRGLQPAKTDPEVERRALRQDYLQDLGAYFRAKEAEGKKKTRRVKRMRP
eukprot:Hpha_TRINITY_DN24757_c0_g1::TRINITY_DN24757_c0_g1_i1::g.110222::m.110222